MTAHKIRTRRTAKGAKSGQAVRIMAALPAADFRRLQELAAQRKVPLATLLRDAVWAYLLPLKGRAAD